MKGYIQRPSRFEECQRCGEDAMCLIFEGPMEEETGYTDEVALCEECYETDESKNRTRCN